MLVNTQNVLKKTHEETIAEEEIVRVFFSFLTYVELIG
jgi:hypothetical protein